jgi:cell division protein FtsW (lipid II flippase)
VTGLVVAAFQPSPIGNLIRDIAIIIPTYIAFMLTRRLRDRAVVPQSVALFCIFLAVLVVLGMATGSSTNPLVGLIGAKVWLMYMPLLVIGSAALETRDDLERLLRTVVVTAWIPLVVGILMWGGAITYDFQKTVEFLYGDFARNATQGFVALKVGETTFYRIPSTFQFVSQYSAFCQFILFPTIMLIRSDRNRRWQIFGYVSLALAIFAALTCGSRGAFLFLPLIFLMLAALRIGMRGKPSLAMAFVLILAVSSAMAYFDKSAILENLVEMTQVNGQQIVVGGLDFAMETGGVFGAGVGTATIAARYVLDPDQANILFSTAIENYYAKAWLELGLLGFVAVVGLFISIIVAGLRNLPKIRDPRLRDAAIAVVGMTMFIAFVSTRGWALDQDPFAYYYYLFVGFMFKLPTLANQPVTAGRSVGRVGMTGRGPHPVPVSGVRPTVR